MICDKINKPDFSDALLEECKKCKWASKLIRWCGNPTFQGMHLRTENTTKSSIVIPNSQIKYPPLKKQAANLIETIANFTKSGFKLRSKEEVERCFNICKSNKCKAFDSHRGRCKACGCKMNFAVLIKSKHCPLKLF